MIQGEQRLDTLHPDLAQLVRHAGRVWDILILETLRSLERQKQLVAEGKSKTLDSKHLRQLDGYAHAVDMIPLPVEWNNSSRHYFFGGYVLALAHTDGYKNIRWGGDWNRNLQTNDQTFNDLVHFEVIV